MGIKWSGLHLELGLLEFDTGDEESWKRTSSALSLPGSTLTSQTDAFEKAFGLNSEDHVLPEIWDIAIHLEDIVVHGGNATMCMESLYKVFTSLTGHDFTLTCMFSLISSVCGVLPLY